MDANSTSSPYFELKFHLEGQQRSFILKTLKKKRVMCASGRNINIFL